MKHFFHIAIPTIIAFIFVAFSFCTNDRNQTPQRQSVFPLGYTVTFTPREFHITTDDSLIVIVNGVKVHPTGPTTPPVDTIKPPTDTTGRFVMFGVNTNHWQPFDRQKQFQGVRYYLPIGWVYKLGGFRGQPMFQAQKQFVGVDDYLNAMTGAGADVLLCLMQSPDWLNGHNSGDLNTNDFPPIAPGADRKNPASYSRVAGIYSAFAKRYGSRTHSPGSYQIDATPPRWTGDGPQQFKSGLNKIKFIEVGNEFDRWWKIGTLESAQYMAPDEHAALLIAAFDSIKAADPTIGVVMAGLTNFDHKYLKSMNAFCKARGRKFPADVINVHHYANAGNKPGVHPPTWLTNQAVAPEIDADVVSLDSVVAFARTIGLPVWVTEFGFDTEPGSQMTPGVFTGVTPVILADQWNVRSALEYTRRGAARAYVFTIADEPNPTAGLYQSSGLLKNEASGFVPKPGFNSFVTLCNETRGAKYVADESTADVRVIRFKLPNGRNVRAYWSPTATGKKFGAIIAGQNVNVTESVQYMKQ